MDLPSENKYQGLGFQHHLMKQLGGGICTVNWEHWGQGAVEDNLLSHNALMLISSKKGCCYETTKFIRI
jgi:hypothetical protein